MQLLAGQIRIPRTRCRGDQLAHLQALCRRLRESCRTAVPDLIVLPELATQEYSDAAFACLDDLDDDLQGPVFTTFADLARELGCHITYGAARRSGVRRNGARRNGARHAISQVLVSPKGRLAGVYDKLHCAQFGASGEAAYFTPGQHLLIADIAGWRLGVMICYDLRFPELARRLADEGVELVVHPVAFTRDFSFASWHSFVTSRAMERQVYWLSLNRAGDAWGHSLFCPPLVDEDHPVTAFGAEETLRWLTLDRSVLADARERLPLSRDRRDDIATLPLWRPD